MGTTARSETHTQAPPRSSTMSEPFVVDGSRLQIKLCKIECAEEGASSIMLTALEIRVPRARREFRRVLVPLDDAFAEGKSGAVLRDLFAQCPYWMCEHRKVPDQDDDECDAEDPLDHALEPEGACISLVKIQAATASIDSSDVRCACDLIPDFVSIGMASDDAGRCEACCNDDTDGNQRKRAKHASGDADLPNYN